VKKRILISLLIVGIIAAGLAYSLRRDRTASGTITISGTIEATTVAASFRIPGRIAERLADEGQNVASGQLLARLATDDLEREVQLREADLATATAALDELAAGTRTEEIAAATASVARLQAEATRAASDLTRSENLYRSEVIATRDLESARAAGQASQAALREAGERLRQLQNGPRPETVRQARNRVASAAAALALTRNQLQHGTLLSPASGVILAKHVEPGEQVAAGSPVVTIGQLDEVWVRGYIPESDLGRVKVGQQAQVQGDTFGNRRYPGTVTFIAPEAEFTPKNVQTAKERVKLVYRIKITLKNPNRELKPGMPVDATIITSP
jgi:HlyD family secretion protein